MSFRSPLFRLSAVLLAFVHLTGAELAGVTHGTCAYHGDRGEHHKQGPTENSHTTGLHTGAPEHSGAREAGVHCTASCCCSVVAAPAALGSMGLLQGYTEGPRGTSKIIARQTALPRASYILPFANAPPVGR